MAKKEHLKFLKQGVEVWNKRLDENPKIKPKLSKSKLIELNLVKANLRWPTQNT